MDVVELDVEHIVEYNVERHAQETEDHPSARER